MAVNKKRRSRAYEIMKASPQERMHLNDGSEKNRRTTAYAIMNQNTRDQKAAEQERLKALAQQRAEREQKKQKNLNDFSNLAYRAANAGAKTVVYKNFNDKLSEMAMENAYNSKYLDSESSNSSNPMQTNSHNSFARTNDFFKSPYYLEGEYKAKQDLKNLGIDENSEAAKQVKKIYGNNAIVKSHRMQDLMNMSEDELKDFTPNSKEEAEAYLQRVQEINKEYAIAQSKGTVDENGMPKRLNESNVDIGGKDTELTMMSIENAYKYGVELDDGQIKAYEDLKERQENEKFSISSSKNLMKEALDTDYDNYTESFKEKSVSEKLDDAFADVNSAIGGLGESAWSAITSFAGSVAKPLYEALNFITVDTFGTGKFAEWAEDVSNYEEKTHNDALEANKEVFSDEAAEYVTMFEEAAAQAIPNVAMAILTGGASGAVTSESLMANATRNISGSTLKNTALTVVEGIKQYMKNPMFTTTFISEAGEAYEDAIENGADTLTALCNGFTVGLLNGLIEMGGGLETGETNFLKDALDEGMEEIWQGSVSNLMAKATYAPDMPLVSTDGSEAVINVKDFVLSFLGGAVGGAAGGGIVTGMNYAANPVTSSLQNRVYGDTLKTDTNTLSQYAQITLENGSKRDVNTANEIMLAIQNGTLDEVSSIKVGKFAQNAAKLYQNKYIAAIAQDEAGTSIKEKTKSAAEIYNTLQNIYTNPEFILNDTRAVMIRRNKVAAEALSRSAGLNSTINAQTPVSTVKTIARMVSNGVNVNNGQSVNIDSTGRVSNTATPAQIDGNAAQRIKNGNGSLSDYLSVTGKTLDDYRDSWGEVNADTLRREAHEIIDNNGILADVDNSALSDISNSRRMLNNIQNGSSQSQNGVEIENISGMRSISPQNIVEIKDGEITLDNGRTVSAESAPLTNDAQDLYTASARYKDNAVATAFINGYDGYGGLDVETYTKNFDGVYNVYKAQGGVKLTDEFRDKSTEAFKSRMGTKAYNAAKQAGIKARKSNERNIEGKKKSSQKATENGSRYSLNPYSQKEKDNWKNSKKIIVYENQEMFSDFINNALRDGNYQKTMYFGKINKSLSDKIMASTGINLLNYNITLRADEVRKIIKSHGNESIENKRGQRAITKQDLLNVLEIMNNYDEAIEDKGGYQGLRAINFVKYSPTKTTVFAKIRNKSIDLSIHTMYSSKKNSNLATVADEKSPASTSKTNSSTVTINSIPQNKNTVNGSILEKISKKGVVTESYKKEWTLSAKEKVTESVIKQIANEYAKRGVNVDIVYDENGHNGQWNPKTNTVTVNLAANNPLAAFFHETSHMVKQYSGEYWNDISLMCITYLAKAKKTSISELADIKKKLYQTENEEFVNEELVSDAVSLIAQDKQAVRKLYNSLIENNTPKSRIQKILDKFKEVLMRLRTHFIKLGKSFNTNVEAVGMSEISGFSSYVNKLSEGLSTAINELEIYGEVGGDTKYSIKYDVDNRPYVVIDEDILEGVNIKDIRAVREKVVSTIFDKFSNGIEVAGKTIRVSSKTRSEITRSKSTEAYIKRNRDVFLDKMRATNNLDEIVWGSRDYVNEGLKHNRKDSIDSFGRGKVQLDVNGKEYSADVIIGHTKNNSLLFYDIINLTPTKIKRRTDPLAVYRKNESTGTKISSSNNNISQNDTIVNNSISENGENDTRFSLKEDVDKIPGVAYNNTKKLSEHNEYEDFMPSGAMGKEIRNKVIQSFANKNFGREAAIVDFYFNDYRMTISYVSPTNYKLIDFHEIEDEKRKSIYAKRNRRTNSRYSFRQGGDGARYARNDDMLSRNGGTAEENAGVSQSQSERNGRGYSGREDVHNGQTETSEAEALIKKYSLMEDVDIKAAQAAIKANQELEKQVKLAGKLFKEAGTVLDYKSVQKISNELLRKYRFSGDTDMRNYITEKLYAFYTYATSEDADDGSAYAYAREIGEDIEKVNGVDIESSEFGEEMSDIIALDISSKYTETAILKSPEEYTKETDRLRESLRQEKAKTNKNDETILKLTRDLKTAVSNFHSAVETKQKYKSEVYELKRKLVQTENKLAKQKQSYEKKIAKLRSNKSKKKANAVEQLRPPQKKFRNLETIQLVAEHGAYEQNEESSRDIFVPKKDKQGKVISKSVKTVVESDYVSDSAVSAINHAMLEGAMSHEVKTNKSAQKAADRIFERQGYEGAYNEFVSRIELSKEFANNGPDMVALGARLLQEAKERGDDTAAADITANLAVYALLGGRVTQSYNMIKACSATGQALFFERFVKNRNIANEKEWATKWSVNAKEKYLGKTSEFKPLVLNEDLMKKLVVATEQEDIDNISTAIMLDIADQVPSTAGEKIQAWRYFSMLFNPTTHIRNVTGNAVFATVRQGQNVIKTGLEQALNKATGGKIKLTTSIVVSKEYRDFAKADWNASRKTAMMSGKFNLENFITQNKKLYKHKIFNATIEKAIKWNSNMLEKEDGIFMKLAYTQALGRYLQANNISLEENSNVELEAERQRQLAEARANAFMEAETATFRNANAIATALTQLSNQNAAFNLMVNSIMPFKKTPANIFIQSMRYSPIGIGMGIKQIVWDGVKGQKTANEIIDTFASGLTGTGIFLLGMLLRKLGILQGLFGDDDILNDEQGLQENSITICGYTFTIDWSAPMVVPLMMGAEWADSFGDFKIDGKLTDNVWQLVSQSVDPLINMTMLEGVNNILTSIKYSQDNAISDIAIKTGTNFISQFVPTIGGKIAQTVSDSRKRTYIDKDKSETLQTVVQGVQKKTPVWYDNLQPYLDAWGQEDKENVASKILQNFVLPGYLQKVESDTATDLVLEVYEQSGHDKTVVPKTPAKYFTMYELEKVDGKEKSVKGEKINLTGEQYTTLARTQGNMSHSLVTALADNSTFNNMDISQKVAVLDNVYDFAKYLGRYAVDNNYSGTSTEKWCRELVNSKKKKTEEQIINTILKRNKE